ncbi:sialidase family protein [Novosphingobium colocasiae]|uniref:sialidase family protein n=1 Tax=Novosphingobium colocasiae TaxID=1256513 RepID=UPI0035B1777A
MSKITDLPLHATEEIDGTETLPIVVAGQTRQTPAAPLVGRLAQPYIDAAAVHAAAAAGAAIAAEAGTNYRATIAEALADFDPGTAFISPEVTAENPGGEDRRYLRTVGEPGYEPTADQPVSKRIMAADGGAGMVGTPTGTVADRLDSVPVDCRPAQAYTNYNPTITRVTIFDGVADPSYPYVHDSATYEFGGYFFAFFNGSSTGSEGGTPQFILMKRATTFEGLAAAPAVRCFSDPAYTNDPINADAGQQWQPGVRVVDGELWVVWNQSGSNTGVYFSRLSTPTGKFSTALQSGLTPLVRNGVTYEEASTTGDIKVINLADGRSRYLMPIVFHSQSTLTDVGSMPSGVSTSTFTRGYKLAGCLILDDGDSTWRIGGLSTDPLRPWCPWEPFFSVQPDGAPRMFVRSLDTSVSGAGLLLTALSNSAAASWTRLEQSGVPVASSRGTVADREDDGPAIMIANDNTGTSTGASSADWRRNLAIFLGNGAHDFVPGLALTSDPLDRIPSYPSAFVADGKLYVTYSCLENAPNGAPSKIKGLIVDPAPPRGAVMARGNARSYRSPYFVTTGYAHFAYLAHSRISTIATMAALSATVQSVLVIAAPTDIGVLFDNRKSGGGWLLQVKNGRLWAGASDNAGIFHDIDSTLNFGAGATGQATYDTGAGTMAFRAIASDGTLTTATVSLGFTPGGALNQATVAYLGCANLSSSLSSITGKVRCIKVWGSALTDANVRYVHNAHAAAMGMTAASGTATAPAAADFDFDATDAHAGTNDATWLAKFTATDQVDGSVTAVTRSGRPAMQVIGSASVGLAPNTTGYLNTHFTVEYESVAGRTQEAAIFTYGDALNNLLMVKTVAGAIVVHQTTGGVLRADTELTASAPDAVPTTVGVLNLGDRVVMRHGGDIKVFPFKGRPLLILGDAWNARASKTDNTLYFFTDTIGAKNAAVAEPAYAHPMDVRREGNDLILGNAAGGSFKISVGFTISPTGYLGYNQPSPQAPFHASNTSGAGVLVDGQDNPTIRAQSSATSGAFKGAQLELYAAPVTAGNIARAAKLKATNGSGALVVALARLDASGAERGNLLLIDEASGFSRFYLPSDPTQTTASLAFEITLAAVKPKGNLSQDLGASGTRWLNIYGQELNLSGKFGCNGATPQAKATLSAALATDGSATNAAIATAINAIRTALLNCGIGQ